MRIGRKLIDGEDKLGRVRLMVEETDKLAEAQRRKEDRVVALERTEGTSTRAGQGMSLVIDKPRHPRGLNEIAKKVRRRREDAARAQLACGHETETSGQGKK